MIGDFVERAQRPAARPTRARDATARSSSARSCGGPTSWASTPSRPVTTCGRGATPDGRWHLLRGADAAKDQCYMLHMLGPAAAPPIAVPGRGRCRRPRPASTPSGSAFRWPPSPIPRICASRRAAMRAGSSDRRLPELVHAGRRGRRPRRPRAGRARRHLRVHGGPAARAGVALGRPPTSSRSTPGQPHRGGARRSCCLGEGWSPTACRGWRASRRPRSRSRPGADPLPGRGRAGDRDPTSATRITVTFDEAQRAVAPGQSAVVYRGDELLGGGRIVESLR